MITTNYMIYLIWVLISIGNPLIICCHIIIKSFIIATHCKKPNLLLTRYKYCFPSKKVKYFRNYLKAYSIAITFSKKYPLGAKSKLLLSQHSCGKINQKSTLF